MAHHDRLLNGDPDAFLAHLESTIFSGSSTASREHAADHKVGDARMLVRVYERYSATGGNRVSLCVSVLAVGTDLAVSVVAAGGSNAIVWKLNTFGEEAFLDLALRAMSSFADKPADTDGPVADRTYMDADGR
jgi:hypothetical protein